MILINENIVAIITGYFKNTNSTEALFLNKGNELINIKLNTFLTSASFLIRDASNNASAQAISGYAALANYGTLSIADAVDGTNIALSGFLKLGKYVLTSKIVIRTITVK